MAAGFSGSGVGVAAILLAVGGGRALPAPSLGKPANRVGGWNDPDPNRPPAGSAAAQPQGGARAQNQHQIDYAIDPHAGRSQKDLQMLYEGAFAVMLADPGDLDKSFRFASLAVRVGDLEGAVAALERMLLINANLPRVRLELGVLYYRLGSYEAARTYLLGALQSQQMPPEVRRRAQRFLALIDQQMARTRFSATLLTGIRWQSNANAAPTGDVKVGGFDADLDGDSAAASDFNAFAAAAFSHLWDFGWQGGEHLDTRLNLYAAQQRERREVDAIVATGSVGPRWILLPESVKGLSLRTAAALDFVMLDRRIEYVAPGVSLSLDKRFEETLVTFAADWRRRDYRDNKVRPFNSLRDGHEFTGRLIVEHSLSETVGFAVGIGATRYKARVQFESYREIQASLALSVQPFASPFARDQNVTLTLSAIHLRSRYDRADELVDPDKRRRDVDWRLAATMAVPITQRFSAVLQGGYNRRDSSLPNYEYDNWFTMAALAYRF